MSVSPLGCLVRLTQSPVDATLREVTWLDENTGSRITIEAPGHVCMTQLDELLMPDMDIEAAWSHLHLAEAKLQLKSRTQGRLRTATLRLRRGEEVAWELLERSQRAVLQRLGGEWFAREPTTAAVTMPLLERLSGYIEHARESIAPLWVSTAERMHLDKLRALEALIPSSRPQMTDAEPRWAPDERWLLRRILQALGLTSAKFTEMVSGHVWRLGDMGKGARRRRVLYGHRLTHPGVCRQLHSIWHAYVGATPAVLITTTSLDRVLLPLMLPVRSVPLAAAFRLQGRGLIADGPVWRGMLKPPVVAPGMRLGPFAADFSEVRLPGEATSVPLTHAQAAFMRALWQAEGHPMLGKVLLDQAKMGVPKPVDAFQKNKYPEANRVYRALVKSNHQGHYWLELPGSD